MSRVAARVVVLLVATVVVAGCGGAQSRDGPAGPGYNAVESTLTVDNVSELAPAWSRPVGWVAADGGAAYSGVDGLSPLARSGNDLAVASLGGSVVLDATTGALRVRIRHSP